MTQVPFLTVGVRSEWEKNWARLEACATSGRRGKVMVEIK
jgi:hypothetical protein